MPGLSMKARSTLEDCMSSGIRVGSGIAHVARVVDHQVSRLLLRFVEQFDDLIQFQRSSR